MIAARQIAFGKAAGKGLTTYDYIQDSIVAMYDGIENAGRGIHDANATAWTDLAGRYSVDLNLGIATKSDCFDNTGLTQTDFAKCPVASYKTIELVFRKNNTSYGIFGLNADAGEMPSYSGDVYYDHNVNAFCQGNKPKPGIKISGASEFIGRRCYVAFTKDERNVTNGAYMNGEARNDGTYNDYWQIGSHEGSIGGKGNLSIYWNRVMSGEFCALRFHSRVLIAEEIAHNYSIDKARFGL